MCLARSRSYSAKKLDIGVGSCRGRFHEVTSVGVQTGNLEDIENVVDIKFSKAVRNNGADKVRVATIVIGGTCEHLIYYLAAMV